MVSLEERVSFVEGRMAEQSHVLDSIRDSLVSLEQRVTALDEKIDRKVDALDAKMSSYFLWLVGILVTTLAALFVAVLVR